MAPHRLATKLGVSAEEHIGARIGAEGGLEQGWMRGRKKGAVLSNSGTEIGCSCSRPDIPPAQP